MQQCFHPSAKHLLYRYVTPIFAGHPFRVSAGETCYFLFLFNLKCIFVSLCKYNSRLKFLTLISSIKI